MDVLDALAQEYDAIYSMLAALTKKQWSHESLCPGWTVSDVVLHLAQTEEMVVANTGGAPAPALAPSSRGATTIDDVVEDWVSSERGMPPDELLDRWRTASSASLSALATADPAATFAWATNPLKPRTLATTRLSEHWIHANDIARPLGIDFPDTERIWHIARLAHRTVPYAYGRAGRTDPPSVQVELVSPVDEPWVFGEPGADVVIRGSASEFCRIAARRLAPADATSITGAGKRAGEVLELVRTYA